MIIPEYSLYELTSTLPSYQASLIKELTLNNSIEEALDIWISVSGPENTVSFGGSSKTDYLKHFKNEFNKFICQYPEYEDTHKTLEKYKEITSFILVSYLSTALSGKLGITANVIAPLVVLALGIVFKIGVSAYISMVKDTIY